MTGIVVVAHSRALATAAVALAAEMVPGESVRIAVAAGLDETTFGTDATAISAAVEQVDDGSGVVVLMDLGSAVLSAELAVELLEPGLRERVVLSAAPLVEGLVVAAVAAAGGAGPAEVAAEAGAALAAKQAQLGSGDAAATEAPPTGPDPAGDVVTGEFEVGNPHGLHARPAAALVRLVQAGGAAVELRNVSTGSGWVPGGSLSRVATLGALRGHRLEVRAGGPAAAPAIEQVLALAARRFDEPDPAAPQPTAPQPTAPQPTAPQPTAPQPIAPQPAGPLPAAPGIAFGPAVTLADPAGIDPSDIDPATDPADVPTAAWHRSERAAAAVRAAVERLRNDTAAHVGPAEAAIFDAHLLLLEDAELLADVRRRIDAGTGPARSWLAATAAVAAELAALPEPYLRERAADVRSIGAAMARELLGRPAADASPAPVRGGILLAEDLSPAQVAALDPARIRGIVLAAGSPTGHAAILARARGIPTVVAAGPVVATIAEGTRLALDGGTGELLVDPGPERIVEFEHRRDTAAATATAALAVASAAAVTVDGVAVPVGANVGSPADAAAAAAGGADLAGLVRTEFLFLGRTAAPDVDEQVAAYRGLAAALGGRRLTLRTLDVGGDKPLPYAPQAREANPFLGVRGIRFALAERELLRTQLQAVVRVAQETPISVMFPMVTTLDELVAARQALDDAVRAAGRGTPPGLQVGIMVEVPAAALRAATFAPLVDFLSVGTNDLTQYALAAERGHPGLAALGDPLDPAVLALVAATCRAAAGGPLVAVCGELAADERATRLLVALGVRELSVTPPAIPAVKAAVRRIERAHDAELVRRALAAPSAAAVRDLLAT